MAKRPTRAQEINALIEEIFGAPNEELAENFATWDYGSPPGVLRALRNAGYVTVPMVNIEDSCVIPLTGEPVEAVPLAPSAEREFHECQEVLRKRGARVTWDLPG